MKDIKCTFGCQDCTKTYSCQFRENWGVNELECYLLFVKTVLTELFCLKLEVLRKLFCMRIS